MEIFKNLVASILSLLLVIILILLPLVSFGASIFEKTAINQLIEDIDIRSNLIDEISINGKTNKNFTKKIIKSDFFEELFTLGKDYILAPLFNDSVKLNEDKINAIVDDNIEELTDITRNTIDEYEVTPKEELKQTVRDSLKKEVPEIVKEIKNIRKDMNLNDIKDVVSILPNIHLITILSAVILSGLIFLATFKHFNGFIWLGADFGVAAVLTFITNGLVIGIVKSFFSDVGNDDISNTLKRFIENQLEGAYTATMIILSVIAAVFIILAIVLKVFVKPGKNKKNDSPDSTIDEQPHGQPQYVPQQAQDSQSAQQTTTNQQ